MNNHQCITVMAAADNLKDVCAASGLAKKVELEVREAIQPFLTTPLLYHTLTRILKLL